MRGRERHARQRQGSEHLAEFAPRVALLMGGASVGAIKGAISMLTCWPLFEWQDIAVRLLSDRACLVSDIADQNEYAPAVEDLS